MANSADPDHMQCSLARDLGLLFAKAYLSQYLGLLWHAIFFVFFLLFAFFFNKKVLIFFQENIICVYSLEEPQHMFLLRNKIFICVVV